jgi:ABC-2 type transport system ATP-binding protein
VGPPPSLDGVDGVTDVIVDGLVLRCQLNGSPSALLRAVAPHEVRAMTTREADIEEVFLAYYGDR